LHIFSYRFRVWTTAADATVTEPSIGAPNETIVRLNDTDKCASRFLPVAVFTGSPFQSQGT